MPPARLERSHKPVMQDLTYDVLRFELGILLTLI